MDIFDDPSFTYLYIGYMDVILCNETYGKSLSKKAYILSYPHGKNVSDDYNTVITKGKYKYISTKVYDIMYDTSSFEREENIAIRSQGVLKNRIIYEHDKINDDIFEKEQIEINTTCNTFNSFEEKIKSYYGHFNKNIDKYFNIIRYEKGDIYDLEILCYEAKVFNIGRFLDDTRKNVDYVEEPIDVTVTVKYNYVNSISNYQIVNIEGYEEKRVKFLRQKQINSLF